MARTPFRPLDPLAKPIINIFNAANGRKLPVREVAVRLLTNKELEKPIDLHAVIWTITKLADRGKIEMDLAARPDILYWIKPTT